MVQVTLEELHKRLAKENHLTWVFYRCKKRTDAEDKKCGGFLRRRNVAWTAFWSGRPAQDYDRIAHWNDKSQILYVGKRSELEPICVPQGENRPRWKIPLADVEVFDVIPKSEKPVSLGKVIPGVEIVNPQSYWSKSARAKFKQKSAVKKNSTTAPDLTLPQLKLFAASVKQLGLDEIASNELRKMVWCRTSAHHKFRKGLEHRWCEKCALTGLKNKAFLVASHIKPWADCRGSRDQADVHNGLLLSVPIDKLFDRGFLSFGNSGEVLLHKKGNRYMTDDDLLMFGLKRSKLPKVLGLGKESYPFLKYHRDKIFNRK